MKVINVLAMILVIIGALNWGLWGFFQFDLVAWVCGGNTNGLARTIYSIVGLAGIWTIGCCRWKHLCCCCCEKGKGKSCCR